MKNRRIIFISVFIGIFLYGVSMVVIGSILPVLKQKFCLNDIEAGGLFSILPFGILIGSITFGPLCDKYGYRWVLSIASLFLAVGFFGIAHAGFINLMRCCVFLFGLGGGVINGAASALISDISTAANKIANLNWLGMFFGVGAFCMPLLLSIIEKKYYTTVIGSVSAVCFLVAIVFAVISYPVTIKKEKISLKLIPVFLKNKMFLGICFYLFFQSAFEALINNWSVSYFIKQLQTTPALALIAFSFSMLGMILMRTLSGSILKSVPHHIFMYTSLILLTSGLIFLIFPFSFPFHVFGLFLIGAGLAPGFPVMLGITGGIYKEVSGTAFSFALFIALTGNMIINYFTGILSQHYGMRVFPYVILMEIVMMIIIFVFIRNTENKEIKIK